MREEELVTLFEVREALETLAARRAARLMTEADFAPLDNLIDCMRSSLEDVDVLERYDTAFHGRILSDADSPRLKRMLSALRAEIVTWRFLSLSNLDRRRDTIGEHAAMVAAIRGGDETRINQTTSRHFANARASVSLRLADATTIIDASNITTTEISIT